jgi:hypothetical protein
MDHAAFRIGCKGGRQFQRARLGQYHYTFLDSDIAGHAALLFDTGKDIDIVRRHVQPQRCRFDAIAKSVAAVERTSLSLPRLNASVCPFQSARYGAMGYTNERAIR